MNIALVIKAFPSNFTKSSVTKIELLNFKRMQKILISFFNDEQDEMFNYYDNRMTQRLNSLRKTTQVNKRVLDKIL